MFTIRRFLSAAALASVLASATKADAQQDYPQTLYWGSGLVDIPVAWVAPITGDFTINYMGKQFDVDPNAPKLNYSDELNSQLVFSMAFGGRVEVGIAAFSSNPEQGFFGRGVLLREEDFRGKGGAARFMPSVAIGVRNVGPYKHIDRFGLGYSLLPPDDSDPDARHQVDSLHARFKTNNSLYGVATKGFTLSEIRPSWPDLALSLSVGYGNGLFKDDGGLGDRYSKHSTGGLFYGVKTDFNATPNLVLTLMGEHNAWDFNLGGAAYYRGISAGLYVTELAASGGDKQDPTNDAAAFYNYTKVAFTLGMQSNIFALLKGDFLQNRATELEKKRAELIAEIARRQQRIAALELEINRYEAQNLLELEQRRAQAEAELRQEREALRRLEERLRQIERQTPTRPPQR